MNTGVEVIAHGTWQQIQTNADRILGLFHGRPNVCTGTGALPCETPPQNVLRLREHVSAF